MQSTKIATIHVVGEAFLLKDGNDSASSSCLTSQHPSAQSTIHHWSRPWKHAWDFKALAWNCSQLNSTTGVSKCKPDPQDPTAHLLWSTPGLYPFSLRLQPLHKIFRIIPCRQQRRDPSMRRWCTMLLGKNILTQWYRDTDLILKQHIDRRPK